jgi:hypothetical protein
MPHTLRRIAMGTLVMCALMASSILASASASVHHRTYNGTVRTASTTQGDKQDALCKRATKLRKLAIKKHGKRAPGRDICRYGMAGGKRPKRSDKLGYQQVLYRMVYPPPVVTTTTTPAPVATAASAPAPPNAPVAPPMSGSSVPACASESGTNYSTGPDNTNPSSGATGRYQELPMHRRPGGLCYGLDLSPAGQDKCASRIFEAQGSGAWVGCGG